MKVSIITPVINEAPVIRESLAQLQWLREAGHELIVVDGGSTDDSVALAEQGADQVVQSVKGRARQMNTGARQSKGDLLLFLHIDTVLPQSSFQHLIKVASQDAEVWGRFDVRLSGKGLPLRVIELLMNWRSRLTGIATGDQAMFISRQLFERLGGFADIPLMEDIEISRRLKRIGRPACLPQTVTTSSRRWETKGVFRTVGLMWRLRFSYWMGSDPVELARKYYR